MADGLAVAAVWLWLGMVLAISGVEAPLKFRAPGITLALGLSIGRLVFRALNALEIVLAALLIAGTAAGGRSGALAVVLSCAAGVVLVVQVVGLRPNLDRRAQAIIAGGERSSSRGHVAYIALEGVKFAVLLVVGVVLLVDILR